MSVVTAKFCNMWRKFYSVDLCLERYHVTVVMGTHHEDVLTLGSNAGCGVTRGFCCPGGGEFSLKP